MSKPPSTHGTMIPFPKSKVQKPLHSSASPASFAVWIAYIKERCPMASYVLLSLGLAWAPQVLSGLKPEVFGILWASLLMFTFFIVLRLMDEVKDYHKDVIAHPERPLPRGHLELSDAQKGVQGGLLTMGILSVLTFIFFGLTSGMMMASTTFYLYLMYREFFCGKTLEQFPILYAASHQAILFLLAATAASCHSFFAKQETFSSFQSPPLGFFLAAIQIFPAFFAYEIGRKMDPNAPSILRYYRGVYGLAGCRALLTGLVALGALGLYLGVSLGALSGTTFNGVSLNPYVWSVGGSAGLVTLFLATWLAGDRRYSWVALAATLNLLTAIYTPIVQYYL